jgi:hypothetical protein
MPAPLLTTTERLVVRGVWYAFMALLQLKDLPVSMFR